MMYVHRRSHLPPIRDQGTSLTRTQEHSTTAAPCCSISARSAGEITFFALGLRGEPLVEDSHESAKIPTIRSRQGIAGRYEAPASAPTSLTACPSIAWDRNALDPSRLRGMQDATEPLRPLLHHCGALVESGGGWTFCLLSRNYLFCDEPFSGIEREQ